MESGTDDEYVLSQAIKLLANIGDNHAVPALIKTLRNNSEDIRSDAIWALGKIGDSRAVEPLIDLLSKESLFLRLQALSALSNIGDHRAFEPSIKVIKTESNSKIRVAAVSTLAAIGAPRAIPSLVSLLNNKSNKTYLRIASVMALGEIGDNQAAEPLINVLIKDNVARVRIASAKALALLNNERGIEQLLLFMKNDPSWDVRAWCAISLMTAIQNAKIEAALLDSHKSGNIGATITLAWFNGGEYVELLRRSEINDPFIHEVIDYAEARWGNKDSLLELLYDLNKNIYSWYLQLYTKVLVKLPEKSPSYDINANYVTRRRQAMDLNKWVDTNRNLISWSATYRRYHIKSEGSENIKQ